MLRVQRWQYWGAAVLLMIGLAYSLVWFVFDLVMRAGAWPSGLFGIDANVFLASLSVWNSVALSTHLLAKISALVLLLRRSRLAFPAYVIAILAGMTDWLLLTGNTQYDGTLDGHIMSAMDVAACALTGTLVFQKVLR